jgi:hypothetical protein
MDWHRSFNLQLKECSLSESLLVAMEISFDLLYLIAIWVIVILMFKKRANLLEENKKIGVLFIWMFFLLALGDTGHVGFRVPAYALGGLEANPTLIGLGTLATAITVTFFYMLAAEVWRVRFNRKKDWIWWGLMTVGVIRLLIMIPAQNQWGSGVPPFNWSLARNIPLMIQGIGIAILMMRDAIKHDDRMVKQISAMIFVSYAFYMPVIFFVRKIPMLGMLMMPKTLAYVAVAVIAYYGLFRDKPAEG